jgi:hypothetical protein
MSQLDDSTSHLSQTKKYDRYNTNEAQSPWKQPWEQEKSPTHDSSDRNRSSSQVGTASKEGSKRIAVRDMAAMFKGHDSPTATSPSYSKPVASRKSITKSIPSTSPIKLIQQRIMSSISQQKEAKQPPPWLTKSLKTPNTASKVNLSPQGAETAQKLRSISIESMSLKGDAMRDKINHANAATTLEANFQILRSRVPDNKPSNSDLSSEEQSTIKSVPSLGKMIPHQEQPAIAQYLNLTRPSSTIALNPDQDDGSNASYSASISTQHPGSTTSLHRQVRNLQRQLNAKTEEAAQLRRQVEAQTDSEVGTLSEQLRASKREVRMWKDRAEAAERRVKVFERFTARLRGIREAAAAADKQMAKSGSVLTKSAQNDDDDNQSTEDAISPGQHVQFGKVRRTATTARSNDSGQTEDVSVVTTRIRKCLHGGSTLDGTLERARAIQGGVGDVCHNTALIQNPTSATIRSEATYFWVAAQELLQWEESYVE